MISPPTTGITRAPGDLQSTRASSPPHWRSPKPPSPPGAPAHASARRRRRLVARRSCDPYSPQDGCPAICHRRSAWPDNVTSRIQFIWSFQQGPQISRHEVEKALHRESLKGEFASLEVTRRQVQPRLVSKALNDALVVLDEPLTEKWNNAERDTRRENICYPRRQSGLTHDINSLMPQKASRQFTPIENQSFSSGCSPSLDVLRTSP